MIFYNLYSLFRILLILIYHQITPFNKIKGEKLVLALQKMGPSFIKLGQTLSTRPDIIGEDIATQLSSLQDNISPFPSKIAIQIIENELGKKLEEIFLDFSFAPVAAASIAQVHKAITLDGKKVAVKILRPNIKKQLNRDIKLFKLLAKFINILKPRLKADKIVEILENTIKFELDFRLEAASASELRDNFQDSQEFYIPEIFWQYTSQKILVTEWIEGISIYDIDALKAAGFDLTDICKKFAISFFNQAFRDGFFHADMHPGNLFIDAKGRIAAVDFGIMGRMDKKTRIYIAEILRGFLNRDYKYVAKIHFDAGYVPATESQEQFTLALRSIGEPIIGQPLNKISVAKLLAQLFQITEDFNMETQPQLLLLQKTMVLVEGVGSMLNKDLNMWELAEPWIAKWAKNNLGFDAKIIELVKDLLEKYLGKF